MKLSIIIVNYNGEKYLGDCLRSIERHVVVEHEVIVVDNASQDNSCEYLRANFPDVKLVESEKNLGFSGGNNLGAREAAGEYLLLLNNDTVLLDDIGPVISLLDRHQDVGIVGAKMLDGNKRYSLSAGHFPVPMRVVKITNMHKRNGCFKSGKFPLNNKERGYLVDWVAGCFLLIRASLWRSLDGLDAGYFMYGEDVDICRRARAIGALTSYCPHVTYIHYGGFDVTRFPLIIAGIRRYHHKFSGVSERIVVSLLLKAGLAARVALYGFLSIMTKKRNTRPKQQQVWQHLSL